MAAGSELCKLGFVEEGTARFVEERSLGFVAGDHNWIALACNNFGTFEVCGSDIAERSPLAGLWVAMVPSSADFERDFAGFAEFWWFS